MTPSSQVKSWDYALAQRAFRPYSKCFPVSIFSLLKHRFHNHCTGSRVTPLFYPRFMHTNPSILLHRPNPLGTWKLEALNTIQVFSVDQRNYEEVIPITSSSFLRSTVKNLQQRAEENTNGTNGVKTRRYFDKKFRKLKECKKMLNSSVMIKINKINTLAYILYTILTLA